MAPRTRKTPAKAAEAASVAPETRAEAPKSRRRTSKAAKVEEAPKWRHYTSKAAKVEEPPAVVEAPKPKGQVYIHRQRIWRRIDDPALPGQDTAAVLAAINAGERPVGPAVAEDITDCGDSVIVTWLVPVGGN